MDSPLWRTDQAIMRAKRRLRWQRPLLVVFVSIVATSCVAVATLLLALHSSQVEVRLDIIKTGLAIGAGAGALITLMYSVRRQLLAEEMARDVKDDAAEKRVIELYAKGVEQFGSDKLPVRLGGLYALERLADSTPDIRGRVVDVICGYLRMELGPEGSGEGMAADFTETAIFMLLDHVAYESPFNFHKMYWAAPGVNLSRATLCRFFFGAAKVDTVHFHGCTFRERAFFGRATFRGANFRLTTFEGPAVFDGAHLGKAIFTNAKFHAEASFKNVRIYFEADFATAEFSQPPSFDGGRALLDGKGKYVLPDGWEIREPTSAAEGKMLGEEGSWGFIERKEENVIS